jgi:hypothetical protein
VNDEPRQQHQSGLSVKTLLIAAAASATAAFVVPRFWEPGTVFAAAMTPIIVTIVSELLKRPVDTVSAVTTRKTSGGAVLIDPKPAEEPFDPLAPISEAELEALPETTTQRAVHRRRPLTARQWKLALVTGLVAFAGAVFLVTAGELIAGEQVGGGGGNSTTFFSGSRRDREPEPTPSPSATATPERRDEATPTPTPTPSATPTPTPAAGATPTPTPTPEAQSPAPLGEEPTATPTPVP